MRSAAADNDELILFDHDPIGITQVSHCDHLGHQPGPVIQWLASCEHRDVLNGTAPRVSDWLQAGDCRLHRLALVIGHQGPNGLVSDLFTDHK